MNGHIMRSRTSLVALTLVVFAAWAAACGKKQPPVVAVPPAPPAASAPAPAPRTAQPVVETLPVPQETRLAEEQIATKSLDDLNRDSPLRPVFFDLDSAEIDDGGRKVAQANAAVMKRYSTWMITVEGHCDERGTAEYNLALGERRATSVKSYMVSLGIPPDRMRIVSYGKEFPFDRAHSEDAWAKNRRAHFVITAK